VAHAAADYLRQHGGSISIRFSKGEKKVLRRRRPVPVSQWAERHRVVEMSSIPGKWKNIFTPYLVGIMDAAGTPGVETVIICKSPQTGGSESGHNLVGWCIDRSPGPVMYVFPDEITARENAKDRIIPMIETSPRLREYMTGYGDDASSLRINLAHMPIYLGWSGSVSRLGNKPIRTLILDELDKYKNPKNEASSESLAEKRTTTWRRRGRCRTAAIPCWGQRGPGRRIISCCLCRWMPRRRTLPASCAPPAPVHWPLAGASANRCAKRRRPPGWSWWITFCGRSWPA
jgi:phage terminase large subunit GpA-like protein